MAQQSRKELVKAIAEDLRAELNRRDAWYGLDNWTDEEVVHFVLDSKDRHDV